MRSRALVGTFATVLAAATASVALAGPASAAAVHKPAATKVAALSGTTTLTTAKGIAPTLLKAGILPLPTRNTRLGLKVFGGLAVSYGFPITSGNPDLTGPSGDIFHKGGINFISLKGKKLEIGKFDVSLADKKVYATEINFKPGRIAVLDLDFSGLKVATRNGNTNLSGITARLNPAAAGAINSTFGTALPADGSLVFGAVKVTLKG
ncbi:MAG: hypothetical protein ABI360_08255 [Allobranchiibius sp.]